MSAQWRSDTTHLHCRHPSYYCRLLRDKSGRKSQGASGMYAAYVREEEKERGVGATPLTGRPLIFLRAVSHGRISIFCETIPHGEEQFILVQAVSVSYHVYVSRLSQCSLALHFRKSDSQTAREKWPRK